jgi:undecaprenyl-diphosphatase
MTTRFTSARPGARPFAAALLTVLAMLLAPIARAGEALPAIGSPPAARSSAAAKTSVTPTRAATPAKARMAGLKPHGWWRRPWVLPTAGLVAFLTAMRIHEGTSHGPFGIDYRLTRQDKNGIFSRSNQLGLEYGTVAFEAAGALVLGNHKGLGHVFWQAADSSVFAGFAADALKYAFRRARPFQGKGPNAFFDGMSQSFPSGEVTLQASFVTPFILHYRHRYPWIWAAELLPIYDAYGRMRSQGHWQSDVLAGWILGSAFGYWASQRKIPLLVEILPRGVSVGFVKDF